MNKITQINPRDALEPVYKAYEDDPTLENYLDLLFKF